MKYTLGHALAVLGCWLMATTAVCAGEKVVKVKPAAEESKVIELDLGLLLPKTRAQVIEALREADLAAAKKVIQGFPKTAKSKPDTPIKEVGLGYAIAAAEKLTGGEALRAEKEDHEKTYYRVYLRTKAGKTQVVIDVAGNVVKHWDEGEDKQPDGKKKTGKKGQKKSKRG